MDDWDHRDDPGGGRGKKKIGRQEERKRRTRKDGCRSWLEEELLGDIGDTSDTEIEKSDYEGRGSPCSQILCSIFGKPKTTRGQ